ncbi:MAG: DUF1289 domain-containing protein [Proteobacteria bacterium]|nr:DUF1289 domain-containing protein [Pseudomonadota bacterium]MBI3496818.1 DUF1289 domain-containing protein [Pseudomonadota bacterium]
MSFDIPLPSPCIAVCQLDPATGYCTGCFRSSEEIGAWLSLDNAGRHAILARLRDRRTALGLDRRRETRRRGRSDGLAQAGS